MNLAQMTAFVVEKWGDITSPRRVPEIDRDVAGMLIEDLQSSKIMEQTAPFGNTLTNTSPFDSKCEYGLIFSKTGNKVHVNGIIKNKSGLGAGPTSDKFYINLPTTGEFQPIDEDQYFNAVSLSDDTNKRCVITASKIKVISLVFTAERMSANFTYITKNT